MVSKFIRFIMLLVSVAGLFVIIMAVFVFQSMSYSDKWIAYVFILCGVLMIIFSWISVLKINKRLKGYSNQQKTLVESLKQNISSNTELLALWDFTALEWSDFLQKEMVRKKKDLILTSVLIVALGTPLLVYGRNASLGAAISVSLALAIIYSLISYFFNRNKYFAKYRNSFQVAFFKNHLLINEKLIVLNDDKISLFEVAIKEVKNSFVLEFRIFWITSKNKRAEDEIYIPVNENRRTEAEKLLNIYQLAIEEN